MNQPTAALPPDAEQIQYLPYGQITYVLPHTSQRPCPIHVFVGSDMHRESVDQWYECTAAAYAACSDPAIYMLHDHRSPKVHFSAYSMSKIRELTTLRRDLRGASAIVFGSRDTILSSAVTNLLSSPRLPRSTRILSDYNAAVAWLCSLMHK